MVITARGCIFLFGWSVSVLLGISRSFFPAPQEVCANLVNSFKYSWGQSQFFFLWSYIAIPSFQRPSVMLSLSSRYFLWLKSSEAHPKSKSHFPQKIHPMTEFREWIWSPSWSTTISLTLYVMFEHVYGRNSEPFFGGSWYFILMEHKSF